jgi:hypothetical protein
MTLHRDTGFRIGYGRGCGPKDRLYGTPSVLTTEAHTSYEVHWQVSVQTATKHSLMEKHWPLLKARFGGDRAEMVELDKRSGDGGPFSFKIRQRFAEVTEDDLLRAVMPQATGMHVSLRMDASGALQSFTGEHRHAGGSTHQVLAFEVVL